ncbi:MAG: CHAD domain-containing protein [Pyrinomonadaceae bacterium]|nr:CHAD domain-containing protein [Pyrinomonadaceae bacterium]
MAKAKDIPDLNYNASVQEGAQRVLLFRFDEMINLREAALDFSDIEGVHNMRVASRRLRSALADFASYFRRRELNSSRKKLKTLASALGEVRDADVAIQALDKLASRADADVAEGVGRLIDERKREREDARAKLVKAIDRDDCQNLRAEFVMSLEKAIAKRNSVQENDLRGAHTNGTSFHDAGRGLIEERYLQLRKLSASLFRPHDSEALHDMRIEAKRLRYTLELFAAAWNDSLLSFADEVSQMQTLLGELHDCDVWIDALGTRLKKQHARSERQPDNGLINRWQQNRNASIWLLQHFVRARTKNYQGALALWHEWEKLDFKNSLTTQLCQ